MSERPRAIVVEHKTAGEDISPGALYWRKLTLDSQCSNYFVLARALGYEPEELLYDVVRKLAIEPLRATPEEERNYTKPKSKQCAECKKKNPAPLPHVDAKTGKECVEQWRSGPDDDWREGYPFDHGPGAETRRGVVTDPGGRLHANQRAEDETPLEFRRRCMRTLAEDMGRYYRRAVVVRTQEDFDDADFDVWQVGAQIHESEKLNRWPRNPDACMKYGRLCDFHDVCARIDRLDNPYRFQRRERQHTELSVELEEAAKKKGLPLLSTSSAAAYRLCPRLYWYRYVQLVEPIQKAWALRFGTLFHLGLEVYWRTGDVWKAIDAMRAGSGEQEIRLADLIKAECMMLGYHVMWRHAPYRVLGVEVEAFAPLINPESGRASRTWQRSGKLDAIAQREGT